MSRRRPTASKSAPAHQAGPSFEQQGVGVDEALFALGLVDENFYESLCPAEPEAVAELEARWGAPLPAAYRSFLESAGVSLGTLQIRDWRTPWDFRASSISRVLEDSEAAQGWRMDGLLPIAKQGPTTELGYEEDAHLLLDLQSGELISEDSNRESYEGLPALILEWGFRLLEPRMAVPFPAARAWSTGGLSGYRIEQLHRLAASMQSDKDKEARYRGQRVGIYLFHDSGVILKLRSAEEMHVEARHRGRRAPESTQAFAFLREAEAAGWLCA